jgi:hypothetical protein
VGRRVGEDICMKRCSAKLVGKISSVDHWPDNRVRGKVTVRDAIRIGKNSGAVIPAITSAACGSRGKNLVPWGVHTCDDTK